MTYFVPREPGESDFDYGVRCGIANNKNEEDFTARLARAETEYRTAEWKRDKLLTHVPCCEARLFPSVPEGDELTNATGPPPAQLAYCPSCKTVLWFELHREDDGDTVGYGATFRSLGRVKLALRT